MNKKFSTLVAAAMLATSVGTVSAQGFIATLPAFDDGGTNAKSVADKQYYQLAGYADISSSGTAKDGVLAMVETSLNSGKYELKYVVSADKVNLNNTLWSVSSRDNGFGTLLFTFTNKGTGEVLSINTADATKENANKDAALATEAIKVGGTISEWRWYNFNKEAGKTFNGTALLEASFANGDSTLALGFASKAVVAVKAKNSDPYQGAFSGAELKVTPYTANGVALSAYDLNTRLQSIKEVKNFNLKFSPDAVGNQWKNWFSNQALVAEAIAPAVTGASTTIYPHANAAAYTDALAKAAQENNVTTWVRLKDATATSKKYVYVDTAFVASQNVAYADRHLKLALDTLNSEKVVPVITDLTQDYMDAMAQRAMFQFTLYPSNDSVVVKAGNADVKNEATAYWKMGAESTTTGDYTAAAVTDVASLITALTDVNSQKNGAQLTTNAKLVKLVYLTDGTGGTKVHSEVTVGAPETGNTLRTKITLIEDAKTARVKTTLASGLYFINLKTDLASRKALNGAYWTANIDGKKLNYAKEESSQSLGTIQNFGHMPQTQWVVEQSAYGVAGQQTVTITNREFPAQKIANVQLYKAGDGAVQAVYGDPSATAAITAADSLAFAEVKTVKPEVKAAYTDTHFGYLTIDSMVLAERIFNLDYLSGIKMGNYVNVLDSKTDSIIYVDVKGEKVTLVLETVPAKAEGFYGYNGNLTKGTTKLFPEVRRTAYNIKVKDGNKLIANSKYVVRVEGDKNATGKPIYAISDKKKDEAAKFFLKENNNVVLAEGKDTCYYALIETTVPTYTTAADTLYAIGANRAGIKDGSLVMSSEANTEERIAAFALTEDKSPLYRRLGVTNPKDGFADNDTAWAKIYTINSTAKEYLYEDANSKYSIDKATGKSLGINFLGLEGKGDDKLSSLYVDTAYVRSETNMPQYMLAVGVTTVPAGLWCPDHVEHNTPEYIATHGDCGHRVPTQGYKMGRYLINAQDSVKTAVNGKDYIWNREYTRLAFVQAKHIADTLVICRNGVPSTAKIDSIFLGNNDHNKITPARPNGIKNPVFAFRLINDEAQADFLIESEGDHKIPSVDRSGWIKIQNGVPVIARFKGGYNEAVTDAEKFNIELTKIIPTANEDLNASAVTVIAGNGNVTILNAAGKTVVISNMLGQTIANTVLTSDNQTIAANGIVVVAVEGEEAVKAIIK